MKKSQRVRLGKQTRTALIDWRSITLDGITNRQQIPRFSSSQLTKLNKKIDAANQLLNKIAEEKKKIQKKYSAHLKDCYIRYLTEDMKNVKLISKEREMSSWIVNINGFDTECFSVFPELIYNDCVSGVVCVRIGNYSQTYNYRIVDDELFIEDQNCLY